MSVVSLDRLAKALTTGRSLGMPLQLAEHQLVQARPMAGEVIALVVRTYDPGLDPGWIRPLEGVTALLVRTVGAALGIEKPFLEMICEEVREISNVVGRDAARQGAPRSVETPLAAFHWSAWLRSKGDRDRLSATVAPLIHVRLRRLERGMLARAEEFGDKLPRNLWDYARSASLLCRYGPDTVPVGFRRAVDEVLDGSRVQAAQVGDVIEPAMTLWMSRESPAPRTVKKRRAHLAVLLGVRNHLSSRTRPGREEGRTGASLWRASSRSGARGRRLVWARYRRGPRRAPGAAGRGGGRG